MENYGRYILLKKLAAGGMAEVFLACPQEGEGARDERVVIKRILPNLAADEHFVTMFLNEARIAARLSHPNIVRLFDLGKEGQSYFLAMEFIHGEDLGALIARLNAQGLQLPLPLVLRIVREACLGLHYAHTKVDERGRPLQLIHRDVSPQNIMVSFEGEVKLLDFGIARAANLSSTTQTGEIKGKYAYIAPEQARGTKIDQRCDIFSLGLVLYELLTGRNPLKRGNDLITLRAAIECDVDPPSRFVALPASLEAIVLKALARDPARRFASAIEFERVIERFRPDPDPRATRRKLAEAMRELFADRLLSEVGTRPPSTPAPGVEPAPSSAFNTLVNRPDPWTLIAEPGSAETESFGAFGALGEGSPTHRRALSGAAAPVDEEEESTVTSRISPLSRGMPGTSASMTGSLEERLEAEGARTQAIDDDEETTVTREVIARPRGAFGGASPDRGSDAFPRPREGQETTQEESFSDRNPPSHPHGDPRARVPAPRQQKQLPPSREKRGRGRRDDGRALPEEEGGPLLATVGSAEPVDEETTAERGEGALRHHERGWRFRAPASSAEGQDAALTIEARTVDWPEPTGAREDEDDEETTTIEMPTPSPWAGRERASERPPMPPGGASKRESPPSRLLIADRDGRQKALSGEQDLFDEAITDGAANRIRSARRALQQPGEDGGLPRPLRKGVGSDASGLRGPRPLMSAEVELIGEPVRGGAARAGADARQARPTAMRGSLAERLEMTGAQAPPGAAEGDGGKGLARLQYIRAKTSIQRVVQRCSIAADRFDELRLRFGIPWSAIVMAILLFLALLGLTLALLAGE